MKLVLQIAGGIVLGSFILAGVWIGLTVAAPMYIQHRAAAELAEYEQRLAEERAKDDWEERCNEGEWVVDCITRIYEEDREK